MGTCFHDTLNHAGMKKAEPHAAAPLEEWIKSSRLLAHFLDVLVRRGVKSGLAGGIGKRHLTGVSHFDGRIGFLFAQRALAGDGGDDVVEIALWGGGELGFAPVAADGNGL